MDAGALCNFLDTRGCFAHMSRKNRVSAQGRQASAGALRRCCLRGGGHAEMKRVLHIDPVAYIFNAHVCITMERNWGMTIEEELRRYRLGWIGTGRMGYA